MILMCKHKGQFHSTHRKNEITQLSALYGTPIHRYYALDTSQATYDLWRAAWQQKEHGEVVLFIRRHNGNLILHSKDFYPAGTFRVPSGRIQKREAILEAVYREAYEETGLGVSVDRFMAVIDFAFHWQGHRIPMSSYLFLLHETGGRLKVQDADEHITALKEARLDELPSVAQHLENMPSPWRDWGLFRAIPHRLAAELLSSTAHEGLE